MREANINQLDVESESEQMSEQEIFQKSFPEAIVELPTEENEKGYITTVFDVGQHDRRNEVKKEDVPVIRIEDIIAQPQVKVENGHYSIKISLDNFPNERVWELADLCAYITQSEATTPGQELDELANRVQKGIKVKFDVSTELEKSAIPEYSVIREEAERNDDNLKDIEWLIDEYGREQHEGVDQTGEKLLSVTVGGKEFEILQSGDMYFLLNNIPTIEVMDAAINEGIITKDEKRGYVSLEEEARTNEKMMERYLEEGRKRGEEKDYRKDDWWAKAEATYGYDAARRLYYLEIGQEPVMDEFERDWQSLLGANAARYDSVVLEVGFGMATSANAVLEELERQQAGGAKPAYIVIEYNHGIAEKAREWGRHQKVPVVVLEGDWQKEIKKIPDEIVTGAIVDPYPMSPEEKEIDVALPLQAVHRTLRPGGVVSYYPNSEYCLSERHARLAKEAGFDYIGSITARFAPRQRNSNDYFPLEHMAVPSLYKGGGTGSAEITPVEMDADKKRDLLRKLFVDNPQHAKESFFRRKLLTETEVD
ncbi:class I SAM-dependent methyltransferase [Patescibacteria group bacterium]|nr:class I SAM-dependent methyltransferase [Patescibacteria group bacterium]MBU1890668.1 class I SAM-dependent methyltransferase [Patescibacteria group bacterium]